MNEEEEFRPNLRKEQRFESKLAKKLDRSGYKKTDQDKIKKEVIERPDSVGRVLSIASQDVTVLFEGEMRKAVLRGNLKQGKTRLKNLIAIGDEVILEGGFITNVLPRRTVLSRESHLLKRKEQLIAANVDQVIVTLSVVSPHLKPFLADRYIIASEKGNIFPVIVVNKIDLLEKGSSEKALAEQFVAAYSALGFTVIPVSCVTNEGVDTLKAVMKDKISVFSGQSGTGKSSLINKVTGLNQATGDIIRKTNKGMHTTSSPKLVTLEGGGFCIDTPGIRSFGVWKLTREEVVSYFDEIMKASTSCRFTSCTHAHEPGCAVIDAVEGGIISKLRYDSYLKLLEEAKSEKTAHIL